MKAIITGATGLVGRHLINEILVGECSGRFTKILALGRNDTVLQTLKNKKIKIQSFDLTSDYSNYSIFEGWTDAIWFNCAAAVSGASTKTMHNVNIEGTRKLIKKAEELQAVRFVHVSSIAVYGFSETGDFNEDSSHKPRSTYADSKVEGENIIQNANVKWTIFRPPIIGGPYDQNFLLEFAKRIKQHKMPFVSRNGIFGFIDARDLARCMIQSSLKVKTEMQIYNVQGSVTGHKEFVNLFGKVLQVAKPYGKKYPYLLAMFAGLLAEIFDKIRGKSSVGNLSRYRIRSFSSYRTLNIDKITDDMNFTPNYSIKQSVIDWFNETKLLNL